ncbi:MAG: carbamoyl phosphate synthase large subunit, partial [Leptospira sp.]|nr:carbamoyl phosphate synthase large subunit [Leptospira sp.]
GSNIQFSVNPKNGDFRVIEMNPRVSRSSALASKATGFPIAKIAAKLAVGYTLDEVLNDITRITPASFEPTIDYTVVKIPRWDFEKFKAVKPRLGIQMQSVGEAMAFGRTFKEALQKAIRSLETGRMGLGADGKDKFDVSQMNAQEREIFKSTLKENLSVPNPDRLFFVRYAFQMGFTIEEIFRITGIDPWFLDNIKQIIELEEEIKTFSL